jgi:glutathione S-transferase
MLRIWGRRTSTNVQKVLWACEELGLAYERIDIGGPFGGLDSPEYRAMNPNGLIPSIQEDDFVLWESHAILRYLAASDHDCRLLPRHLSVRERARIDQWLDWAMVALGLSLRTLFMLLHRPGARIPGPTEVATAAQQVASVFAILDQHLRASAHVAGSTFTLADIPCGISAHRWFSLSVTRPSLPALEAWYGSISSRPAFQTIRAISLSEPPR